MSRPVPTLDPPLALWSGVRGIPYAFVHHRFPGGTGYWVAAFLCGAMLTSIVAPFVVPPLEGGPLGAGGDVAVLIVVFLIDGMRGVGTGVVLRRLEGRSGTRAGTSAA